MRIKVLGTKIMTVIRKWSQRWGQTGSLDSAEPTRRCMCGFREARVSFLEKGRPELNLKMKGGREGEKGGIMRRRGMARAGTRGREEWNVL